MLIFISGEFWKNLANVSRQFTASADRRFQFHKRAQLFLRTYNVTFPAAMCVCNPDRSPARINRSDAASTPNRRRDCQRYCCIPPDFGERLAAINENATATGKLRTNVATPRRPESSPGTARRSIPAAFRSSPLVLRAGCSRYSASSRLNPHCG